MSLSFSIPYLRSSSTIPVTVPAGQTWIIKYWQSNSLIVKVTQNGVQYLFAQAVTPNGTEQTGMSVPPMVRKMPTLKAGDSIDSGNGVYFYYIMEQDFNTNTPAIPDIRNQVAQHLWPPSPGSYTLDSFTYNIPAGKVWKILHLDVSSKIKSAVTTDMLHTVTWRQNSVIKTLHVNTYQSISVFRTNFMQLLNNTGLFLRGDDGDYLKMDITFPSTVFVHTDNEVNFNIGYWDMDLDF